MSDKSDFLRGLIGLVIAILLIFAALKIKDRIVAARKAPEVRVQKQIKKVIPDTVINSTIPVEIKEKGNLSALQNVELYSEVQGVLEQGDKLFKPGQKYAEGEVILSINDSEFVSSLKAERSKLYNQLAQAMPDLRLDYPEVFEKWSAYLETFDINEAIPELPAFSNPREKYFINSKGLVTSYYSIRNLEERQKKFKIYAPFYSVVSEALVFPGALVRPGQKLGEVLNPSIYEMAVSVDESYSKYITVGKRVTLSELNSDRKWTGRIARIDPAINTLTQGITVYIEVTGSGLKAGMFLEVSIQATPIENSFEISRKLLVGNKSIYLIRGDSLALVPVDVAFYKEKSAIVTNLPDSLIILKNPIPGAYDGMLVEIINM